MANDRRQRTAPSLPEHFTRDSIVRDYRLAVRSREASLLGRKEVFSGRAKFGIFGDGKEVAQLALARAFRAGDWRSGYYRDQTLMFALGLLTVEEFFAQLYADADVEHEPSSGGRQMTAHFATRFLDADGSWRSQIDSYNSSADVSPTGSQMPRLVGLAQASKVYRQLPEIPGADRFSKQGNEIAFGMIGNASCAEGMFWEALNAIGVLEVPALLSIWDDGYGISVPNEHQITKQNLSELLRGFQRSAGREDGYDIYTVRGWDYPALCETYLAAAEIVRREHLPAVVHVTEMTQPQGHSTSGSHERYKSRERLTWEQEFDCVAQMRLWMREHDLAEGEELDEIEAEEKATVRSAQERAWKAFRQPIEAEREALVERLDAAAEAVPEAADELGAIREQIAKQRNPLRRDLSVAALEARIALRERDGEALELVAEWHREQRDAAAERMSSHLMSESPRSALAVEAVPPIYAEDAEELNGFEILNRCFDAALEREPRLIAFGEDLGKLGDVNQGFAGLQEKYGEVRVADTGIRETTILGQAIGLAMRGLRPLAEVQYLDYLLYCLQIMSDDLATLRWRTKAGQMAPVVVRTRGHRLEGVWHAGSPMGGIVHLLRGLYICVPRDMTRAAGMYNTLLASDDPALVVEVLNGYRVKERLPRNLAEMRLPLGEPEILRHGSDVTIVTYGACCAIVERAADLLSEVGIEAEIVDVQTLQPFDRHGRIADSIRKTNRVVFVDEDVPGGATAFMAAEVLERQRAFFWLDAEPRTVTSRAHRPAYGSDGDYFSKPNREEVFEAVYDLMREADPRRFPPLG
ncbi:MAG: thiamine pyrophosphate-dependent enzyme [Thermoanaerobaculia bacterium]|nr:thiamine pyrophosphate-dependent enzyme [Thermoanaerobaculia bacterium]